MVAWIFKQSSLRDKQFSETEDAASSPAFLFLKEFFHTFANWQWATAVVSVGKDAEKKYQIAKTDKMVILTPTHPYRNSARNVSDSTLKYVKCFSLRQRLTLSFFIRIITNEMQRAQKILKTIEEEGKGWDNLFRPLSFFQLYPTYLQIDFCSLSEKELQTW